MAYTVVMDVEGFGILLNNYNYSLWKHVLAPMTFAVGTVSSTGADGAANPRDAFRQEYHLATAATLGLGTISNALKHKATVFTNTIGNFKPLPPESSYSVSLGLYETLMSEPDLLVNYGSTDLEHTLEGLLYNGLPFSAMDKPKAWGDLTNALIQSLEQNARAVHINTVPGLGGRQFALVRVLDANSLNEAFLSLSESGYATTVADDPEQRQAAVGVLSHQAQNDALATALLAAHIKANAPDIWQRFINESQPERVKQALLEAQGGFRLLRRFRYRDNSGNPAKVEENREYLYLISNNAGAPIDPSSKHAREAILTINLLSGDNALYDDFVKAVQQAFADPKFTQTQLNGLFGMETYKPLFFRFYPDSTPHIEGLRTLREQNRLIVGDDDYALMCERVQKLDKISPAQKQALAKAYFEHLVSKSEKRQLIQYWYDFSAKYEADIWRFHYKSGADGTPVHTSWSEKKQVFDTFKQQHGTDPEWKSAIRLLRRLLYREARHLLYEDATERPYVAKLDEQLAKDVKTTIEHKSFNDYPKSLGELEKVFQNKKMQRADAAAAWNLLEQVVIPQFNAQTAFLLGLELGETYLKDGKWYVKRDSLTIRGQPTAIRCAHHPEADLYEVNYHFGHDFIANKGCTLPLISDRRALIRVDGIEYAEVFVPIPEEPLRYVAQTLPRGHSEAMQIAERQPEYSFPVTPQSPQWQTLAENYESCRRIRTDQICEAAKAAKDQQSSKS